ncbi:hypothetical protein M404DRAFT_1000446 [Pisolithus tinctorius Marx 270]|uniref:C2H2-type domain-containing protein n=1 Tax=Pisolithus tinctorius Marx 270 TaxID=870435 RepID=A0A0C3J685_PISTI|nr:hypothetical protein M404DRAFT_1000446 [Pisolithus tinctorius Marx 270]
MSPSSVSPQSPTAPGSLPHPSPQNLVSHSVAKKKHVCQTCDRGFTTSGHLARHIRVHTGERNHKCPFPGCETRCSRQDNLQQHYRIHLSPGSRRSSSSATRAAIARAVGAATGRSRSSGLLTMSDRSSHDGLTTPPPLEHAIPPPPDSPPALVPAYPIYPDTIQSGSVSSRSSTPLENSYPIIPSHSQPLSNGHVAQHSPLQTHFADSPPSFEPAHSSGYGYHAPSTGAPVQDHSYSYYDEKPSTARLQSALHQSSMDSMHDHSPPSSAHVPSHSSRLSISHLSHPQSYPVHYSTPSPDSSHSVSVSPHSQASEPSPPNYSAYRSEGNHDTTTSYSSLDGMSNGYMPGSSTHIGLPPSYHATHHPMGIPQQNLPRYDSPPPILAPIQDERVVRGDMGRLAQHIQVPSLSTSATLGASAYTMSHHHPHAHSSIGGYSYHASPLSMGQGWKSELLRGRS